MTKLPIYLNEAEFTQLIKATKSKKHKLAFMLGFNSGLRVSEVVNLRPEHININKKRVNIIQGKGGKDRVVPLPRGFPLGYLSLLPLNITPRALQMAFKRALAKAGVNKPQASFHSLRHSFAVQCLERGMPINIVQVLLGHSNVQTTSIYTKVTGGHALKIYDQYW